MTLDPFAWMGHAVEMASTKDILQVEQVAELAGVKKETIYQHMFRGSIPEPEYRFGQTPAWNRKTIEKWVATRRTRKPSEKK